MCATRSSTTAMWSRICAPAAPSSSTSWTRCPPGAMTVFQRPRRRPAGRGTWRAERGLPVIDATCPLVAKVHNEGRRYAAQGREIVLVGHAGHAEVEGTIGQIPGKVHLVQTVDDVADAGGRRSGQAGLHHPDHAVGGRHARTSSRRCKARFPGHRRPGRARHLLRHAEPPAGGARAGRAGGRDPGGRRRATAPTPTGCARSARNWASRPT